MERRNMLALAGAALPALLASSSRAFAQTTPIAPLPVGTPLDRAQYRMMTLMGGSLAMQSSQIALQKAANAKVREFAGFEVAEQTTIAQVLTDMANPAPAPLDAMHAAMLAKLQAADAGLQFDQVYILGQLQGHQELFAVQNNFLQAAPSMASDDGHIAMLARTSIQMHLAMLGQLRAVVGA